MFQVRKRVSSVSQEKQRALRVSKEYRPCVEKSGVQKPLAQDDFTLKTISEMQEMTSTGANQILLTQVLVSASVYHNISALRKKTYDSLDVGRTSFTAKNDHHTSFARFAKLYKIYT
jgi:hypothetical protein